MAETPSVDPRRCLVHGMTRVERFSGPVHPDSSAMRVSWWECPLCNAMAGASFNMGAPVAERAWGGTTEPTFMTKDWCVAAAVQEANAEHAAREAAYEAALTRAKSALENWGRHHRWCPRYLAIASFPLPTGELPECTCGFFKAISDADPVNVANGVAAANAAAAPPLEGQPE